MNRREAIKAFLVGMASVVVAPLLKANPFLPKKPPMLKLIDIKTTYVDAEKGIVGIVSHYEHVNDHEWTNERYWVRYSYVTDIDIT